MSVVRRSVLWALGAAVLAVAGIALYAYFVGTSALLEHAEQFAFRRMNVAQLEHPEDFRFFYISNRQQGAADAEVAERYTASRDGTLKFGSFDTHIEPRLGLGMLVDPSAWFLNEEIQLQQVQALQEQEFVEQLRQQVDASPQRSLLLVVHGFREAFPSALRKTAFVAHVLDIDTPVLLFDWPGNQGSSLRGYRRARNIARESGGELAQTLRLVIEKVRPQRLWLMANSMGGQVVVDAFSLLYRDAAYADLQHEIENVVLTAPDVDHREFNEQFKNEIKALARNLTLYVSSNDRALLVSRIINRGKRLGESTLDPGNPGQVEETESFMQLLEPGNDQLILVDVTPVNRTRNFHNFSLETPEFFDDLFLRFTMFTLPVTRELYPLQAPSGSRYFVLTRGN